MASATINTTIGRVGDESIGLNQPVAATAAFLPSGRRMIHISQEGGLTDVGSLASEAATSGLIESDGAVFAWSTGSVYDVAM